MLHHVVKKKKKVEKDTRFGYSKEQSIFVATKKKKERTVTVFNMCTKLHHTHTSTT